MEKNTLTNNRVGLFISGFRWSGSSAVSDWLESFSAIRKPPDSIIANDEIRALNYGLTFFLKAAEKSLLYGEKLARYSMWPEKKMWKTVFGKPLALERGALSLPLYFLDTLFMAAAKKRLNPGIDAYEKLLCSNLNVRDYRLDTEYLERLRELTEAVRYAVKVSSPSWSSLKEDRKLKSAVSGFLVLFYDRLGSSESIPLFDNAFSGLTPRFFDLVGINHFRHQLIIFVVRDPRDQFAEQVRYSTKTFPFMARKFASDYRLLLQGAKEYAVSCVDVPGRTVKIISFEDFVLDRDNTRSDLKMLVGKYLDQAFIKYSFDNVRYDPEKSRQNIGLWKTSAMKKELALVEKMLPEYIRAEK